MNQMRGLTRLIRDFKVPAIPLSAQHWAGFHGFRLRMVAVSNDGAIERISSKIEVTVSGESTGMAT